MNHVPVHAFKNASKIVSFTQISARCSAGFYKKKQSVLLIFLSPLDPKISRRWPALAAYESRDSRYTC